MSLTSRLRFDFEKLRDPEVAGTFQAKICEKFAPHGHRCYDSQCVNEVYHEQEAASCVSGITRHVYLRLW